MTRLLIIIILCLFAYSFNVKQASYVVTPGVGTQELQVGKTKIKAAVDLLGKYDKYTSAVMDRIDADAIYVHRYMYQQRGVKLVSDSSALQGEELENDVLDAIEFEKPAIVATDNNIVLGKSNSEEIIKAFGKPDDEVKYAGVSFLFYTTKGISFLVDNQTNVPIKMSVYKKNKRPSFKFY